MAVSIPNIFTHEDPPGTNVLGPGWTPGQTTFTKDVVFTNVLPNPGGGTISINGATGEVIYSPLPGEAGTTVCVVMDIAQTAGQCGCGTKFQICFEVPAVDPCVGKDAPPTSQTGGCPQTTVGTAAYNPGTMDINVLAGTTGWTGAAVIAQASCSTGTPGTGTATLVSGTTWRYQPGTNESGTTRTVCFSISEDGCTVIKTVTLNIVAYCTSDAYTASGFTI